MARWIHWEVLGATDFFTVEVWTLRGLVRYHVLFVIRLSTRKVHIAGIVPDPAVSDPIPISRIGQSARFRIFELTTPEPHASR